VPEVAVYEDGHVAAREHQVWGAAMEKLAVETKPCARCVQGTPEQQFRLSVFAAATAKTLARLGRDPLLSHGAQSSTSQAALPTLAQTWF
jgi:hypothetical protein